TDPGDPGSESNPGGTPGGDEYPAGGGDPAGGSDSSGDLPDSSAGSQSPGGGTSGDSGGDSDGDSSTQDPPLPGDPGDGTGGDSDPVCTDPPYIFMPDSTTYESSYFTPTITFSGSCLSTYTVDWGDGGKDEFGVDDFFPVQHVYDDDGPRGGNGTPYDDYTV